MVDGGKAQLPFERDVKYEFRSIFDDHLIRDWIELIGLEEPKRIQEPSRTSTTKFQTRRFRLAIVFL